MAKEKNSFVMYYEWGDTFRELPMEKRSQLIIAIFDYAEKHIEPDFSDDLMMRLVWNPIHNQLDRDNEKYKEKCKKNAENGSKGGKAKGESYARQREEIANVISEKQNLANAKNAKSKIAKIADNDYDTDADSDDDYESGSDNESVVVYEDEPSCQTASTQQTTQQIPSLSDVKAHMVSIGFAETSAELTSSDFYTYNQKRCWSFLGSARWQDKLMDWICRDYALKEEYDAIQKRRAKEQEEAEKERLRWEEFDAKYYDNHPDPFSIVQNADDFVTYIRGNKHFQFDDDTCKRMDHFFLDEELIQMYEDGAVNTDEQYGSCIKYLYACGKCKELIEHFNHNHERACSMEPFVWKSREEEQEETEKLIAAREDEFAYEEEEEEYDDLPFS